MVSSVPSSLHEWDTQRGEWMTELTQRDNLVSLKDFKRRKRLKQKAKRKARKLEQSKPNSELVQHKVDRSWLLITSMVLGIIMAVIGTAITARNAWMQGDNDIDRWLALGRDTIPEIALYIMFGLATVLWNKLMKLKACIAVLT